MVFEISYKKANIKCFTEKNNQFYKNMNSFTIPRVNFAVWIFPKNIAVMSSIGQYDFFFLPKEY